ncbi:LysR family transcriptional regulator [Cohnella kolymensis]|uniref:LysR family transcriptional regulator n=1 Tax=Cohnella kolymensis TaxID=1590652 RepID=A0ABR5A9V6_9BACL|nr:LysR family transcriptional regulator [Cohnella kolymensis]KIL37598.1 LysR family transcriptional regulator [Cohnella kolymensis]
MEIRDLQYVVELARCGSFTRAAEELHITQPTLSKMIKKLEEELGVQLFTRAGKRVELTDAGNVLVEQSQNILDSFRSLTSELDDLTNFNKGSIRIGLPPMVGANFFPKIMSRFREKYPGLVIDLVEAGSKKVEAEVAGGHLDMGVVLLPIDADVFDSFTIVKEKLRLIVHPSHPFAAREEVALSELSRDSFILFRQEFALHDKIITECRRAGFDPLILYESSQWDFIVEMVAADLGVALLPEVICKTLRPDRVRVLSLVEPEILWHLAMVWRKKSYLSFAAREWIRFTQKVFEQTNH